MWTDVPLQQSCSWSTCWAHTISVERSYKQYSVKTMFSEKSIKLCILQNHHLGNISKSDLVLSVSAKGGFSLGLSIIHKTALMVMLEAASTFPSSLSVLHPRWKQVVWKHPLLRQSYYMCITVYVTLNQIYSNQIWLTKLIKSVDRSREMAKKVTSSFSNVGCRCLSTSNCIL